ncbi:2284_t:CDS:2 [Diversispora eburnea]|uniref:2284_t:CDS:1 n=1 Tax=Diversispora eburnea TaxID=1213867 RepID=A0A9N9DBN4_9GLOM|nr:2284_t:CDS:2 [Diversispora eburnea]
MNPSPISRSKASAVSPSVEMPMSSRPVTPALPSLSQNVNVINVTINYSGDSKGIGSDEN